MSIDATYIDLDTFTIVGDQTLIFHEGRRVRADCGVDLLKYGTISSVSFDGTNTTTVDLTAGSDNLTSNLVTVKFGIIGKGTSQSMPDHVHDSSEGDGGDITAEVREWTAQQNFNEVAITSSSNAVAWDTDVAQCAVHTLTEDTTISAPSNLNAGGTYVLRVVQAVGVHTLAFNAAFKWGAEDAPVAPAANGDVIILTFYSDGSNMYGGEFVREEA